LVSNDSNPNGLASEFFIVDYVNITQVTDDGIGAKIGWTPDVIFPANYSSFSLVENQNFPLWILFNASSNASNFTYNFTLKVGSIALPLKVKVFNFKVPEDLHFYSQMNVDFGGVLAKYGASQVSDPYWQVLEKFKVWLIQHRVTPNGPLWSGGLTSGGCPYVPYNCTTKTWKDTYGIWGFEANAIKYVQGKGFNNGHGWPHFIALGMKNVINIKFHFLIFFFNKE